MILFGHLGLTAGAVKFYEGLQSKKGRSAQPDIDYRFVLLGSVLPDLIDKPIGALLFINTYHNSRIYAHTLLFSLILVITGVILLRRRRVRSVLTLAIGSMFHLVFDCMWLYPETLLWPFLNIKAALSAKNDWFGILVAFPYRFDDWLKKSISSLLADPSPLIYELAGLIILAFFLIRLLRGRNMNKFFRAGKL